MKNKFIKAALVLTAAAICACASKPKNISGIDITSNTGQETAQTRRDIDYEKSNQLSLLSPNYFKHAEDKLEDSEEALAKNKSAQKVFEELAISRGWLDDARQVGQRARVVLAEPLDARANALTVFDPDNSELISADKDLKNISEKIEKNKDVTQKAFNKLTAQYIDVERERIVRTQINPIEGRLKQARSMNAKRLAKNSYSMAEKDLDAAKATLKIEPYDRSQVASRILAANKSSSDLMAVVRETASGRTSEEIVLGQRRVNAESQEKVEQTEKENRERLDQTKSKLENARETASETEAENRRLKGEMIDLEEAAKPQMVFQKLQERLPADEAEVFMEGDGKIIVRVRDLNFKPNSADLTPDAAAKLTKVRSALNDINPRKILIEGHTDSTGSPEKNKALSESRALTVATVLKANDNLKDSDFETKGLGSEKPLKKNTTKTGRAENRRVEITIDTL